MKNKNLIIFVIIVLILIICAVVAISLYGDAERLDIIDENISVSEVNKSAVNTSENSEGSIINSKINKTGDTTDLSRSDRQGLNAAVLVNLLSKRTIESSEIITSGKGASGVVATGPRAVVNMSDTKISTTDERSKGILVSDKGNIIAKNLEIETTGYKSSAVATDFGGGKISIEDSTVSMNGEDSVGFYATSEIVAKNVKAISRNAEGAVIDGSGRIDLTDVEIEAGKKRGVMLFYTGPEMKHMMRGSFKMIGGSLMVNEGPAFYVMNTIGEIYLENVDLSVNSGVFLQASVDEFGELGQEGEPVVSKGGNAEVVLNNQVVSGDVVVDGKSTFSLEITNGSVFNGAVNVENTAVEVKVRLDETSRWSLTGDSYVTELDLVSEDCIIKNGFEVYVVNE